MHKDVTLAAIAEYRAQQKSAGRLLVAWAFAGGSIGAALVLIAVTRGLF